jgi:hypothetical protein
MCIKGFKLQNLKRLISNLNLSTSSSSWLGCVQTTNYLFTQIVISFPNAGRLLILNATTFEPKFC